MTENEFVLYFGRWLRSVRMNKRMSLVDLQNRINISWRIIDKWEYGKDLPDVYQYLLIIKIYGQPDFLHKFMD